MVRLLKWVLAFLLMAQAFAASAVSGIKYISTPGDYVGQGMTGTVKVPEAKVMTYPTANHVLVTVDAPGNGWSLDFAAPGGGPLVPGSYPDAMRYPFQSPMGPGLDVSGNSRGCNRLKGWFRVLEYELDATGAVTKLAIDFVQNCEVTGPPLYGAVRVRSRYPLVVPDLQAIAGSDSAVVSGQPATLDGTQSFSRRFGDLSYRWTQLDGPAVVLDRATSAQPSFTAPAVGLSGATLYFQLDVTERSGRKSSDDVVVLVLNADAPRTEISFRGDPGDYITGGRSYNYDPYDAVIWFQRNPTGGVSGVVSGTTHWQLNTAPPSGSPFTTGTYLNAQRYPFPPGGLPGLEMSGDGRGCNTLTGQFTVHQLQVDSSGNPQVLDLTFEQHCEGGAPAAYGQFLLNAVPHTTLAPQLRAARQRYNSRQ